MIGLYKVEVQTPEGSGKLIRMGGATHPALRDAVNVAFQYFKANSSRVSGSIHTNGHDYLLSITDLQGAGQPDQISFAVLVALCGASLKRSTQTQAVLVGDMTIGGTVTAAESLASTLQVAFDSGAKTVFLPTANAAELGSERGELLAKFQSAFYSDPVDGVFKALGVG